MLLDVLLIIFLISGFINGYRRGLIRAVFSFVALLFGILIALKYSYVVSDYFYKQDITQSKFLPLICFILVLFAVIVIVQLISRLVEKMAEALFLGTFNKLIGGALEAAIMVMLLSTVLWYLDKMQIISHDLKASSKSYDYLISFSPAVTAFISKLLPFFRDVFDQLEKMFPSSQPPNNGSVIV